MNTVMQTLLAFPWLLLLVKATLILSAGLITVRFMRKSGPAMRYLVWLTVFAALLILPFVQFYGTGWHLPVTPGKAQIESSTVPVTLHAVRNISIEPVPAGAEGVKDQETVLNTDSSSTRLMLMLSDTIVTQATSGKPDHETMKDGLLHIISGISPLYLLIGLWVAGIFLLLSRLAVGRNQANRLYRDSRFVSGFDWQFVMDFVRKLVRLSSPVDVVQNRQVSIPLTFGVARPVVMLPGSAGKWDLDRRRIVLMHEFVHVKRRDDLLRLVARLVTIVYWFHPLAWLAFHHLKEEQEKACDETVLKSGIRASDYATHLVDLTRGLRPIPLAGAATLGMARRKELEGRLTNILDPNLKTRKEIPMKRKLITIAVLATVVGLLATVHLTARAASWDAVSADGHMNQTMLTGGDQEKPETPPAPETPATPEEVKVTTEVAVPPAPEKAEKEVLVKVKAPRATWVSADDEKNVSKIVVDVDSDTPDTEKMFFVKKGDHDVMFISPDSVDHVRKEVEKAMVELKKAMAELARKKVELGKLDQELKHKLSTLKVDDKEIQRQVQEAMTKVQEQLKQQMEQNHHVMEQLQQSMEKLHQQLNENEMTWHAKGDEMTFQIQKLHELGDLKELKELEKLEVLKELEALDEEELARKAEAIAKVQEANAKRIEVIVKADEAESKAREEAMRKREKEIQEKVEKRLRELEEKGLITEQQAMEERHKAMEEAMRARELELKKLEEVRMKELKEKQQVIIMKQMALDEQRLEDLEEQLHAENVKIWKEAGGDKDFIIKLDRDDQYTLDELKGGNLNIAVRIQTEGLEKSELKKLQKAVKKLKKAIPDNVTLEDETTDTSCLVRLSAKEDVTLSESERDQLDKAVDTFMDAVDEIKGVDEEDVRQIRVIKRDDNHAVTIKQKTD